MTRAILLVGELNPYGRNPSHALYPWPPNCAGWRLCYTILGMEKAEYLAAFNRVNLCYGKWSIKSAREAVEKYRGRDRILLGAKVAAAHGINGFEWFSTVARDGNLCLAWPHPSGLCRVWNDVKTVGLARESLERFRRECAQAGSSPAAGDRVAGRGKS